MKWYLGVYESNDSRSVKSCNTILLFGAPNTKGRHNNHDHIKFGWKHVALDCPHCNYVHDFKRMEWNEEQDLPNFCEYNRSFIPPDIGEVNEIKG